MQFSETPAEPEVQELTVNDLNVSTISVSCLKVAWNWFGGEGNGKCIIEFIYDDNSLPSCVAFSGSWGYYNWNGLDLSSNITSIKKINYGEPVEY